MSAISGLRQPTAGYDDILGFLFKELLEEAGQEVAANLSAPDFVRWGQEWLKKHYIISTFPVESNLGVRFENQSICTICPGDPAKSPTQVVPAGDVPISTGDRSH